MLRRSLSVRGGGWLTTRDDVVGAIVMRLNVHRWTVSFSPGGGVWVLEDEECSGEEYGTARDSTLYSNCCSCRDVCEADDG